MEVQKKSHKEWRKNAKKLQRKRRRRLIAMKRDEGLKQNADSPTFQIKLAEERALELVQLHNIEQMNEIEQEKWIESELRVERQWQIQKRKLEEQAKKKEEERQRIQAEFEAEQRRIEQIKEEKQRRIEEEKQRHIDLEMRIQAYIDGIGDQPPELLVDAETNPGKELCQYFMRMAACRFGHSCIKNHQRPKIGNLLLIQSFFTSIQLDQNKSTEYGNDLTLEYDEIELCEKFNEFFVDVVEEFEQFGCIRYFVVSNNYEPHLRGHVFIEYTSQRNALNAQRRMNGRYYAGRMLNVEFRKIQWEKAICGASLKHKCVKGRNCGFFHIFKNPNGKYSVEETVLHPTLKTKWIGSVRNVENDDWNSGDDQSKTNRRWSESPIREVVDKNLNELQTEKRQSRTNSRSKSTSHKKRRKRSKNRSRSRSQSKKRRRKSSRSGNKDKNKNRDRNRRHKSHKKKRKD